jgi:hypothetical protein
VLLAELEGHTNQISQDPIKDAIKAMIEGLGWWHPGHGLVHGGVGGAYCDQFRAGFPDSATETSRVRDSEWQLMALTAIFHSRSNSLGCCKVSGVIKIMLEAWPIASDDDVRCPRCCCPVNSPIAEVDRLEPVCPQTLRSRHQGRMLLGTLHDSLWGSERTQLVGEAQVRFTPQS